MGNINTLWIVFRRWFGSRLVFHHNFAERFVLPFFIDFCVRGIFIGFLLILAPLHVVLLPFLPSLLRSQLLPPFLAAFLMLFTEFFVPLPITSHFLFPDPNWALTYGEHWRKLIKILHYLVRSFCISLYSASLDTFSFNFSLHFLWCSRAFARCSSGDSFAHLFMLDTRKVSF